MAEKEDLDTFIDNVTDAERDLAQNALAEFKKKNYNSCLQHLHKLEHRTNDFKVSMNKAVVEYCKSDLKKTEIFENALASLCNQFEIKLEKLDDVNHCVVHYNQVVLLYHQRKYIQALRIMDRIYKFIEPMDDTLARQVSFLAIELQLLVKNPDKALTVVTYMENHLLNAPTNPQVKPNEKNTKETEAKITPVDPVIEALKLKIAKYKSKCYLMKQNLSAAKNEIMLLSKDNLKIDALFLTANSQYLAGNFSEAMKTLSSIPADCLTYRETGESSNVLFYNNMGIIHHALGKPNLACHYFQLALKEDLAIQEKLRQESDDKPLFVLGGSKYHELIYNLGIALLHANRYAQAFDCLIIAVRRYHRNSRLWLRIAECCIKIQKPNNDIDFDLVKKQKQIVTKIIGGKDNKKMILNTNFSTDKKYSVESQSFAIPVPTLEFASICLRNAFTLIPSDTQTTPVPLFLIHGVTPPVPNPSPGPAPSSPLDPDEIIALRCAILAASSYVSLCLGDYLIALEQAESLLSQPRVSPNHILLGRLYAAESLVLLNKIPEALKYLNPENIKEIGFDLNPKRSDEIKTNPPPSWFPTSLMSVQAVLHYNCAVAQTLRGQLDQAMMLINNVWQIQSDNHEVPAHVLMLVIYIELQLGQAENARNYIKQWAFRNKLNLR